MKWRSSDEASNLDSCLDKVPVDDSQERVLNRERNFPLYGGCRAIDIRRVCIYSYYIAGGKLISCPGTCSIIISSRSEQSYNNNIPLLRSLKVSVHYNTTSAER